MISVRIDKRHLNVHRHDLLCRTLVIRFVLGSFVHIRQLPVVVRIQTNGTISRLWIIDYTRLIQAVAITLPVLLFCLTHLHRKEVSYGK